MKKNLKFRCIILTLAILLFELFLNSQDVLARDKKNNAQLFFKFRESIVSNRTRDFGIYIDDPRIEELRVNSLVTTFGLELLVGRHWSVETDLGFKQAYYTSYFKGAISTLFFTNTTQIHYHIYKNIKNYDAYFSVGTFTFTDHKNVEMAFLGGLGFAYHFQASPWQVFFEPAISLQLEKSDQIHMTFGVGYQF